MKTFDTDGYELVRGAIGEETARLLSIEFEMIRENIFELNNIDPNTNFFAGNDPQVERSFSFYSPICFDSLLLMLQSKVEEVTGKTLYPAYSYARIYYNGAEMASHIDRPSCQYSATLTLQVDETPWEIYMENFAGEAKPLILPVGDMVVYRGDKLKHWRNKFEGKKQIQVFLHYVDANGEYADYKFDKRKLLGSAGTKHA